MRPINLPNNVGSIAFMIDERISRERQRILSRITGALRQKAKVDVYNGYITQEELLHNLEKTAYQLVLIPWYRYLAWKRVEAFFGLTRTQGPTIAGYFADEVLPYELGEQAEHSRTIILDFANLNTTEALTLILSLANDSKRSGLRPLLPSTTPIYYDTLSNKETLGSLIDRVFSLEEIEDQRWKKRSNSICICLTSLWSLVFGDSHSKTALAQLITSNKAYFQIGIDMSFLAIRICYSSGSSSLKDALSMFWPDTKQPTLSTQLLLKYADFIRVHPIADSDLVEVVVGFMPSAPSIIVPNQTHTLWVEPLAQHLLLERPYQTSSPEAPFLKQLPNRHEAAAISPSSSEKPHHSLNHSKDKFIKESIMHIRELRKQLIRKDDQIIELRMGGVSTAAPPPPPDTESLLEAFQEHFLNAQHQIKDFEDQIEDMKKKGSNPQRINQLQQNMTKLAEREAQWIQKISSILNMYQSTKLKTGTDR